MLKMLAVITVIATHTDGRPSVTQASAVADMTTCETIAAGINAPKVGPWSFSAKCEPTKGDKPQ